MRRNILSIAITLLFLLSGYSCQKDNMGAASGNKITFTAGGSANIESEGEVTPDDSEYLMDKIYCIISRNNTITSIEEAKNNSGKYEVEIKDPALYDLAFIANPSNGLLSTLQGTINSSSESLYDIIYTLEAGNYTTMVSVNNTSVNIDGGEAKDLGEILFQRPVARIDILNAADNIIIKKAEITNKSISGNLFSSTDASSEYATETIEDMNLEGNSQNPAYSTKSIYTLENNSSEKRTNVRITYAKYDEELTVDVPFDSGIKRNSRYVIAVCPEGNSNITANKVKTWNNEDAIIVNVNNDKPYEPVDNQEELNKALAINNFTIYNVKTITDDSVVEFYETTSMDANIESYFPWQANWETKIYRDAENNYYRVPDEDEISLLMPKTYRIIRFDEPGLAANVIENLPATIFDDKYSGGDGKSDFLSVQVHTGNVPNHVVYAIRFKNTPQVAAYRYEWINYGNNNTEAYLEIKVKGIDQNQMPGINDIQKEEYWEDEYLLYNLPAGGYEKEGSIICMGTYAFYWTSTSEDEESAKALNFFSCTSDIYKHNKTNGLLLKLVKTDKEPEPEISQKELNDKLVINRFNPYNVASINEETAEVTNTTKLPTDEGYLETDAPLFSWNSEWAEKIYTENGKQYRIPTKEEMTLVFPVDQYYVVLDAESSIQRDYVETLPDMMFSQVKNGGEGKSDFETVQEEDKFITYAIRFMGTEQRAAYRYEIIRVSEDNSYISVKVKGIADDYVSVDDIKDADYWSSEYIELTFPFLGKTAFNGNITGLGENGHYWTSTSSGTGAYAAIISKPITNIFSTSSAEKNKRSLKLINVD